MNGGWRNAAVKRGEKKKKRKKTLELRPLPQFIHHEVHRSPLAFPSRLYPGIALIPLCHHTPASLLGSGPIGKTYRDVIDDQIDDRKMSK